MRVGVLGGTFDPVHVAHLRLAEEALEALGLDEILFVPAGDPWRKSARPMTPAEHRLAMLRSAVVGNDGFGISDIELRRPGPSYTADTLAELAGERLDDEFWFIVGADALADLPNWHEPARIVAHATLAVAPREPQEVNIAALAIPGIAAKIETFPMTRLDISSTEIRARVAAGRSIRYLVPDAVERYILAHALYRPPGP
ncbi:MAG TPA: nicotinate-nucleotide adenylyltransferase [Dehalococcoidia bacterium]|nr:nicotinate-nucleotide adenylyltransferase [Dehalococcoidia bacterium]